MYIQMFYFGLTTEDIWRFSNDSPRMCAQERMKDGILYHRKGPAFLKAACPYFVFDSLHVSKMPSDDRSVLLNVYGEIRSGW